MQNEAYKLGDEGRSIWLEEGNVSYLMMTLQPSTLKVSGETVHGLGALQVIAF
jgi:hypothetical protein